MYDRDSVEGTAEAEDAEFTAKLIAEIAAQPDEEPEAAADAPVDTPPQVKLDAPVKPPTELPVEKESEDRATIRFLEREARVRDREQAAEAKERELERKLAESAKRPAFDKDALVQRLMDDPVALFEELGADPNVVSRLAIAGTLGDKAPAALRGEVERIRTKREIDTLRAEMRRLEAERSGEAERTRVRNASREFAARTKGESTHPTLTAVAKLDPEHVATAIYETIARDARERGVESSDQLMSPEKAAAKIEAEWAILARAFAPADSTSTNVEVPAKVESKGKTVAPPATQAKTSRPSKRKAYYEPDEAEDDAIFADALKIAKGLVQPTK